MKFDVYGRFQLEVVRENEQWAVYKLGLGKREPAGLVVPATLAPGEVATYLDDLLHELARPGQSVQLLR